MHDTRRPRQRLRLWSGLATVLVATVACSDDSGGEASVPPTLAPLATSPGATTADTSAATPAGTAESTTITTTTSTTIPDTTTSSTTTTTTTTLPPTTTTIVTQGAVVLVANATNVGGAASVLTQQLRERTFTVADPTNAAGSDEVLDTSKVYFKPDAEAVARSVAMLMGDIPLARMPIPAPVDGANIGLGDAGVLVMLGRDLAGKVVLR
jgi:hypothetical protein